MMDQAPRLERIAVLGAGAWGTALAQTAARGGRPVLLWTRAAEFAASLSTARRNARYLPDITLEPSITLTSGLEEALACDAVLAATPAQHLRAILRRGASAIRPGLPVAMCCKGIEQGTLALMSDVLAEEAPEAAPLVLSGPGFAKDVAGGLPTATTIAGAPGLAAALAHRLAGPSFRPYVTDDLIGAQIGGAVKNVIAIACGVALGRGLGESARAALITRGFAEMCRFGLALGARLETLNGLSGLGDLVLTCTSLSSRNTTLGYALGSGGSLSDALAGKGGLAEGAASAPAVKALAARCGVEMPICTAVAAILDGSAAVDQAIAALLARPLKAEGAG